MRTILNVLGAIVSIPLCMAMLAVMSVVCYTVVYAAIYVAPFICLGHYVWRRWCR